jgi:SpoVK/Ycf46/Vps4 family AAA+-type ATPase
MIAHWSNLPQVKMQDAGGAGRAKAEILAISRNRLTKQRSSVVQNGIVLYGPQGTGKNLLAREFGANFHHVVAMRRMDPNAKELPLLSLVDLDQALGRVQPRF